ncbi:hypothetical protein PR048_019019 [Dryococelus australis]|uniref:Uncharacterized protein n=1 Tax=Dryococelus australis TaxID=614101 RepID=A0ABQ9H2D5_9NEOP|nr:hypothetical protein PR048_019019 [Dryococelus australis]
MVVPVHRAPELQSNPTNESELDGCSCFLRPGCRCPVMREMQSRPSRKKRPPCEARRSPHRRRWYREKCLDQCGQPMRNFLGNLLFIPALVFRRCSILTSITLIGSQDLDDKSHPNLCTPLLSIRCRERKRVRERELKAVGGDSGATVAKRLAHSPPTKALRIQSPVGSLRIFACGNHPGRFRWSVCFLGDLLFPPAFHSCAAPYSPQSPSSALKTSLPSQQPLTTTKYILLQLQALNFDGGAAVSERLDCLPPFKIKSPARSLRIFVGGNRSANFLGDFPLPHTLYSGIAPVAHLFTFIGSQDDNHMGKSRGDPTGNRARSLTTTPPRSRVEKHSCRDSQGRVRRQIRFPAWILQFVSVEISDFVPGISVPCSRTYRISCRGSPVCERGQIELPAICVRGHIRYAARILQSVFLDISDMMPGFSVCAGRQMGLPAQSSVWPDIASRTEEEQQGLADVFSEEEAARRGGRRSPGGIVPQKQSPAAYVAQTVNSLHCLLRNVFYCLVCRLTMIDERSSNIFLARDANLLECAGVRSASG